MSKKEQHSFPPLHTLVGDSAENFYQLGLMDNGRHSLLLDHAIGLIRASRWSQVNKGVQEIMKTLLGRAIEMHPRFKKRVEAYAEGVGEKPGEVAAGLLIPEIMSFIDKWVPGIPHTLLGCSSYFIWDDKRDALVHGRTLDFPFHGSFDLNERVLQTQLDDGPVTLSFSSAGFPYPSITAMTANGVTLGLHQKFSRTFNYQGTPIFDLVFELLQNCSSRDEAIRFLKKENSITAWALYMGFEDGKVLSAEIDGEHLDYNVHQATPGKLIYFCNERENHKLISNETMPYGFQIYNEMRKEMKAEKLKSLNLSKGPWTAEKLLRFMGTSLEQVGVDTIDWKADPMTPATLQNICMIPGTGEALMIGGRAPKFFNGEAERVSQAFKRPEWDLVKIKGKTNSPSYQKGVYHYMQAQVGNDLGDWHKAYHHIQLAIDYFEGNPYQTIAKFFFCVFQYMHETEKKALANLLKDFKELDEVLPSYLQDHNSLFIARLEKIIKGTTTIGIDEIQHPVLQRIFDFEKKMPRLLFHSLTKELMNPRLEVLDIIYPHVKA